MTCQEPRDSQRAPGSGAWSRSAWRWRWRSRLVVVATAGAAATPPFEPDPSSLGGLRFFDAAGNEITSGNVSDAPFAAYVQASGAGRDGDTKATLYGYLPKSGVPISGWSGEQMTASPNYPNASAPAALAASPLPLVSVTSGDFT